MFDREGKIYCHAFVRDSLFLPALKILRNWRNAIPLLFLALFTLFPAVGPFLKFREVLVRETSTQLPTYVSLNTFNLEVGVLLAIISGDGSR